MDNSWLLFAENNWYLLPDEEKEMGGGKDEVKRRLPRWAFVFFFFSTDSLLHGH